MVERSRPGPRDVLPAMAGDLEWQNPEIASDSPMASVFVL